MSNTAWPPAYTIRKSKRAKRMRLVIKKQGLEIVMPHRSTMKEGLGFLEINRDWVKNQLQKISDHLPITDDKSMPSDMNLLSLGKTWKIHYIQDHKRTRLLERKNEELVIFGDIENRNACLVLLRNWLRKNAQHILLPWLERLSKTHNLPYERATIRGQTGRWGSCSSKKIINLNYKLLFLPEKLVEHVLLHELSHTVHMNHGEKFWNLLRSLDLNCDHLEQKTRRAQLLVPNWVDAA